MSELPSSVSVLVIGAGVHGLSTAWHLARKGTDVLVVDKTGVAAGASGIACGVVRNNYFQPAMAELMAACVEIWESDPEALRYHGTGYIALGPAAQESDLVEVHERHQRIGYDSELITGEDAVAAHMRALYPDWRAKGLTVCLHEHRGGFAFNKESMLGLADKARAAGARIAEGVEVTGFERDGEGAVTAVHTSAGDIAVEQVVVAVGPWIAGLWEMLGLPAALDVHQPDGERRARRADVDLLVPAGGRVGLRPRRSSRPPTGRCRRSCTSTPTRRCTPTTARSSPTSRGASTSSPTATRSRAAPRRSPSGPEFTVDPYPTGTVEQEFPDLWCASLSHCLARFEGARERYRQVRSGGVGAFTADNFPVFDYMAPNVYVAADSNHGYKMIAVGKEIAEVLGGGHSSLLYPFRYDRFATGDLHPVSNSPYPWS